MLIERTPFRSPPMSPQLQIKEVSGWLLEIVITTDAPKGDTFKVVNQVGAPIGVPECDGVRRCTGAGVLTLLLACRECDGVRSCKLVGVVARAGVLTLLLACRECDGMRERMGVCAWLVLLARQRAQRWVEACMWLVFGTSIGAGIHGGVGTLAFPYTGVTGCCGRSPLALQKAVHWHEAAGIAKNRTEGSFARHRARSPACHTAKGVCHRAKGLVEGGCPCRASQSLLFCTLQSPLHCFLQSLLPQQLG
eukprot:1159478-Pelagomonas_calceolata.AAC.13